MHNFRGKWSKPYPNTKSRNYNALEDLLDSAEDVQATKVKLNKKKAKKKRKLKKKKKVVKLGKQFLHFSCSIYFFYL